MRLSILIACVLMSGCSLLVTETTFGDGGATSSDAGPPPDAAGMDAGDRDAGEPFDAGPDATVGLCTADSDCSDGAFCNGEERCDPAAAMANRFGCVSPSAPACGSWQECDEDEERCRPTQSVFGDLGNAQIHELATDSLGRVYVVGCITEAQSFGGDTFTPSGSRDAFIAAFDSEGGHLWSRSFGGASNMVNLDESSTDCATSVAVDASDRVYVRATVSDGTLDLGDGPVAITGGGTGLYVSYDATGSYRWMSQSRGGDVAGRVVVVRTDAGSERLVGLAIFAGETDFEGRVFSGDEFGFDFYVALLDPNTGLPSQAQWGRSDGFALAEGVAAVGESLFVTGTIIGTGMIDSTALTTMDPAGDAFVIEFNEADLGVQDVSLFGGEGQDGFGPVVADSGTLYVQGQSGQTFDLAPGITVPVTGSADVYIAALEIFEGDPTPRWVHALNGDGVDRAGFITLTNDSPPLIVAGGLFIMDLELGGGTAVSEGLYDLYVVALSIAGTPQWSHAFGSSGSDRGWGAATTATNTVLIGANLAGLASWGGVEREAGSYVFGLAP